jgi:hypothetical protein
MMKPRGSGRALDSIETPAALHRRAAGLHLPDD